MNQVRHAFVEGGVWHTEIIASYNRHSSRASAEFDQSGRIHAVFDTGGIVKYAVQSGGTWEIQDINDLGIRATNPSLALDSDGQPHVTFFDNGGVEFASHYATMDNGEWQIETVGPTSPSASGSIL